MFEPCPCYQCPDRTIHCKASCPNWKKWEAQNEERRKMIIEQRKIENFYKDLQIAKRERARSKRHKRTFGW